jgi:peptide-methionine (S)-S-oxide reductase
MLETATFGGGCFWKIEESFRELPGVIKTSAGYMGGHFENPSYLDVVARITGHAEVAQVFFEPEIVEYNALLDRFWGIHDPTSFHRQGPDRGEQYRSVIFWHTAEQRQLAEASKQRLELSGRYEKPIVTEIQPASVYWLASDEHQQYLMKRRSGIVTK